MTAPDTQTIDFELDADWATFGSTARRPQCHVG